MSDLAKRDLQLLVNYMTVERKKWSSKSRSEREIIRTKRLALAEKAQY